MTLEELILVITSHFDVKYKALIGNSKQADLARARRVYFYIAKYLTSYSDREIADKMFRCRGMVFASIYTLNKSSKKMFHVKTTIAKINKNLNIWEVAKDNGSIVKVIALSKDDAMSKIKNSLNAKII